MKNQKENRGLYGSLRKYSDRFFDKLKADAVNKALEGAKNNKTVPSPMVDKLIEIEKASRQLHKWLKELEE
mgnify:CR=1 FL=1